MIDSIEKIAAEMRACSLRPGESQLDAWADRLAALPKGEPVAWTGKGCGVMNDTTKRGMIEDKKYGGEFASAARMAEQHDIPLYAHPPLPVVDEAMVKRAIQAQWIARGLADNWDSLTPRQQNEWLATMRAALAAALKESK